MGINNIIDEKTNDVRVNISDAMRTKAAAVGEAYDRAVGQILVTRQVSPDIAGRAAVNSPAYSQAMAAYKEAIYEANPYLDPDAMRKSEGTPMFTQRIDMERAVGKVLNDLIRTETRKLDSNAANFPRPFDEKNTAQFRT